MARRRGGYTRAGADEWSVFPPPSRPIRVKGGIRAQSTRGKFVEHWWAERWIAVLESFDIGGRLGRGRAYARQGQVLSIQIANGTVVGTVQGSRSTPYEVTIGVKTLTAEQWGRIVEELREEAVFAARLLAGEMPRDIELIFERAKLSLFPTRSRDLKTYCSCPDESNPCKHIAAVYYLLGEEFDRDPFLLFALRGMPRDQLLATLAGQTGTPARKAPTATTIATGANPPGDVPSARSIGASPDVTESHAIEREPPAAAVRGAARIEDAPGPVAPQLDAERFWRGGETTLARVSDVQRLRQHADVLRRLGKFPFWRGETPIVARLEPIYADASQRALERLAELVPGAGSEVPGGRGS